MNDEERYKQILRKYLNMDCKISFEDRIRANKEFIESTEFKEGYANNKDEFEAGKKAAIEIHKMVLEAIEQHQVKGDMLFMEL